MLICVQAATLMEQLGVRVIVLELAVEFLEKHLAEYNGWWTFEAAIWGGSAANV